MTSTPPTVDVAITTMISLVGSLADNKGALGRRYGEWAVSAPSIESAVAAAAMAQDELGHARATYPVLSKLGVEREGDALDGGRPLHVIERELPDWASFIAANLVVDGILTTFVATARESSIESLAQRARKILHEEGAHRVHAQAWLKRMCRAGPASRDLLLERIDGMWAEASLWPGPERAARLRGSDRPRHAQRGTGGDPRPGPDVARRAARCRGMRPYARGPARLVTLG